LSCRFFRLARLMPSARRLFSTLRRAARCWISTRRIIGSSSDLSGTCGIHAGAASLNLVKRRALRAANVRKLASGPDVTGIPACLGPGGGTGADGRSGHLYCLLRPDGAARDRPTDGLLRDVSDRDRHHSVYRSADFAAHCPIIGAGRVVASAKFVDRLVVMGETQALKLRQCVVSV
jgi:hypothetical protein